MQYCLDRSHSSCSHVWRAIRSFRDHAIVSFVREYFTVTYRYASVWLNILLTLALTILWSLLRRWVMGVGDKKAAGATDAFIACSHSDRHRVTSDITRATTWPTHAHASDSPSPVKRV
ncbi:hypothetical protein FA95DRAFT_451658 [Auriscalpium vulgare]|uniref:Uncharacterized protein n=1 Tax=Auriscalpium vulgare TaxID=40419 RepID=A0ACB8SCJ0_9AGAM|nr:hypothetical protein FA95DRAFT_451658 [Auriscalpium vulgare]